MGVARSSTTLLMKLESLIYVVYLSLRLVFG